MNYVEEAALGIPDLPASGVENDAVTVVLMRATAPDVVRNPPKGKISADALAKAVD